MDFRHLIVTCLFSMLRLSFETQKIKENYAIFKKKSPLLQAFVAGVISVRGRVLTPSLTILSFLLHVFRRRHSEFILEALPEVGYTAEPRHVGNL